MGDAALRKTYYNRLNASIKRITEHTTKPLAYHEAKEIMIRAQETWSKYEEVQGRLYQTAVDDSAFETQEKAATLMEETYFELRSKLRPLIESLDPAVSKSTSSAVPTIRLPSIELPSINGNIAEWTSFKDLFSAAVGSNAQLGGAQKLQYLKSSVQGEAAALIRSLATTDSNYSAAWKMLNERYDNEREIVHALVNKLLSVKEIKNENSADLQRLVDIFMECVRALQVLKRPVEHWDDLLVVLVLNKLDASTRREWAIRQTGTALPTFKNLTDFLRAHVRGLQVAGAKGFSSADRRERPVRVHMASAERGSCLVCSGSHPQYQCPIFKAKSVGERKTLANEINLCWNCLGQVAGKM